MKPALILFTRVPEKGTTKTRLAAAIGATAAVNLQIALLKDMILLLEREKLLGVTHFCIDPYEQSDSFIALFPEHLKRTIGDRLLPQIGTTLGERMSTAFETLFNQGHSPILLFGSDIPLLGEVQMHAGFQSLITSDQVICPTQDGGYCLIGLKGPTPEIFKLKNYGNSQVFEATLKAMATVHAVPAVLKTPLRDLDTFDDLLHFKHLFETTPERQNTHFYATLKEVFSETTAAPSPALSQ